MDPGQRTGNTAGVNIVERPDNRRSGSRDFSLFGKTGNDWRIIYHSEVKAEQVGWPVSGQRSVAPRLLAADRFA